MSYLIFLAAGGKKENSAYSENMEVAILLLHHSTCLVETVQLQVRV